MYLHASFKCVYMPSSFNNNYLSNMNYLPGTVLGAGDVSMNKQTKSPALRAPYGYCIIAKGVDYTTC